MRLFYHSNSSLLYRLHNCWVIFMQSFNRILPVTELLVYKSIFDINQALEQEPDNALLQERLLRTYRDELSLLRRVGGLTRDVMRRNDI